MWGENNHYEDDMKMIGCEDTTTTTTTQSMHLVDVIPLWYFIFEVKHHFPQLNELFSQRECIHHKNPTEHAEKRQERVTQSRFFVELRDKI